MALIPVILFAYAHPDHLRRTLECLRVNHVPLRVSIRANPELVINIASYHLVQGAPTSRAIERHCQSEADIIAKTVFPLHPTTVLFHSANHTCAQHLAALPSYDD